ncbi:MAG: DUF1080 domain-containing protein [Fimbriimonadales bacterium]
MIAALAFAVVLQTPNTLTPQEVKAGWILLFDGKTTKGWHNFKEQGIRPGWVVKDGVLTSADPNNSGDIVTDGKYDWFELQVDFNYEKGQNSGIMFHCADDGEAMWYSGPEVQIYDHPAGQGVEITGYLYELYSYPGDVSKPAGQWNHFRILISPKKCETDLNGVKLYEYVLGSKEFWARVAKSKFAAMPKFAKLTKGTIGIQGDHGAVSFRNIKLRPIKG